MLLGYGAKNCWSFKEWIDIDLSLDANVPTDTSMNLEAATAMCFKGANASGKTNALKVFAFITDFATNSFLNKPDTPILFDTYFMNKEPAEFYIEFTVNKVYYLYQFTVSTNEILEEHLSRKLAAPKSRETEIFTRKKNEIIKNTLYKGHVDIIFRKNASFISTLVQYGLTEINDVYNFLYSNIINVSYTGLNSKFDENINTISRIYFESHTKLLFAQEKIRMFDTGIKKIEILSRKDEKNNIIYFPVFYHEVENNKDMPFLFEQESSGTRKLFCNLLLYATVLEKGSILILDEFDINIHPEILPVLLKLFIVKDNNPNNAQLIFTTHNNDIMDLLGKYRIYLFQKEEGESYCYRLDETPLRNDRSILTPYKKGLIGGVPKIKTNS